jgi:hypothetical protein
MVPTLCRPHFQFGRLDEVIDSLVSTADELLPHFIVREVVHQPVRAACLLACVFHKEFLKIVWRTIWPAITISLIPDPLIQPNL